MSAVLAAASYSRGDLSLCLAGIVRRVMVPGGITFHLEPGTIDPSNIMTPRTHETIDLCTKGNLYRTYKLFCLETE